MTAAQSAPPLARISSIAYVPSALEDEWTARIAEWDATLCAKLASPGQKKAVALLLELFDSQERFEAGTAEHANLLR